MQSLPTQHWFDSLQLDPILCLAERAWQCVDKALKAGGFQFLDTRVLKGRFFRDEPPVMQDLCVDMFHRLVMHFLHSTPGR